MEVGSHKSAAGTATGWVGVTRGNRKCERNRGREGTESETLAIEAVTNAR